MMVLDVDELWLQAVSKCDSHTAAIEESLLSDMVSDLWFVSMLQ